MQGVQVLSLVGELGPHMPWATKPMPLLERSPGTACCNQDPALPNKYIVCYTYTF